MKKIIINGNKEITGNITVSGAKNSAVALIPAALLSDEEITINNVPDISDIDSLIEILEFLGADVIRTNSSMRINSKNVVNKKVPQQISSKLRASYYFMSALLGKYKFVEMYFPGGCSIGSRPIDQTLSAFELLGAEVKEDNNFYVIKAENLIGNDIHLAMPSVGATINAILVAVKAEGHTKIFNAAKEPEITNLIDLLNNMGAKIKFNNEYIEIEGVRKLGAATITVIPDRIEAGTYIIAGALIGKELAINNISCEHIKSLTDILLEMKVDIQILSNKVVVSSCSDLKPVVVETKVYPGFPTDLQQPLTTLLTQTNGISSLTENIYENRFQNIEYLNKMNSDINIDNKTIIVNGKSDLQGADVKATDLRAGACLVLAGLKANGTTIINEAEHILRGYENIVEKLVSVGADIAICE